MSKLSELPADPLDGLMPTPFGLCRWTDDDGATEQPSGTVGLSLGYQCRRAISKLKVEK